jgi:DNA-binding NtrC family response regulator
MSLPLEPTRKTIPLVENQPLLQKFVRTILERAGFTVPSATTADGATQVERDLTGTIDLLLTGVWLPGCSGPDLAEQLQRNRPGLRVMLMSSDPATHTAAANYGWSIIEKPFLPAVLLDRVKDALARDVRAG